MPTQGRVVSWVQSEVKYCITSLTLDFFCISILAYDSLMKCIFSHWHLQFKFICLFLLFLLKRSLLVSASFGRYQKESYFDRLKAQLAKRSAIGLANLNLEVLFKLFACTSKEFRCLYLNRANLNIIGLSRMSNFSYFPLKFNALP